MSIVLTRAPLEVIGMNGGATQKRRSARLSGEGNGENEPPAKKAKVNGGTTTTINTKQQDGEPKKAASRKKRQGRDTLRGSTGGILALTLGRIYRSSRRLPVRTEKQ